MMRLIIIIPVILLISPEAFSQNEYNPDSIKRVIASAKHDSIVFNAYKYWDDQIYRYDKKLDEELNLKMAELVEKNLKRKNLTQKEKRYFHFVGGGVYNTLGIIFQSYGKFEQSLNYYDRGIRLYEKINDRFGLAKTMLNKGSLYFKHGNRPEAMKAYLYALKVHEKDQNYKGMGLAYNNIGVIYKDQGDEKKAYAYYKKSLEYYRKSNHKEGIALAVTNLANIEVNKGNFSEAAKGYAEAMKLQEEIGDLRGKSTTLINFGQIQQDQGDYATAEKNYKEALEIRLKINYTEGIAHSYFSLGYVYTLMKRYREAKECCHRALAIADEAGLTSNSEQACGCLYNAYNETGDAANALHYFIRKTAIRDSLYAEEKTKEIMQREIQFSFEKKAAEDSLRLANIQAVKDARQKAELKHEQTIRYFLFGGLAIVLIFAIIIFNRLRVISSQKKIIEEQKMMVDEKQKEIIDSIHYAKRIQNAILPSDKYLLRFLKRK